MNDNNCNEKQHKNKDEQFGLSYSIKDSLKGILWIALFYAVLIYIANHYSQIKNFLMNISIGLVCLIILGVFLLFIWFFIKFISKLIYLFKLIIRALEKYIAQ